MEIYDDLPDAGVDERIDQPRDQGPPAEWQHRLRYGVRDRAQPHADARGEDHRFHARLRGLAVSWSRGGWDCETASPRDCATIKGPPARIPYSPADRFACGAPDDRDRNSSTGLPDPCSCRAG